MKLNIYNWQILTKHFPKVTFSKKGLKESLLKVLLADIPNSSNQPLNDTDTMGGILKTGTINIIFVSSKKIRQLNKDFRKKETQTDVLSFLLEEKPLVGEIYVCPEYISKEYPYEEVLRAIVHGFLHLVGYEHIQKFTEDSKSLEEMFVKQENMLENILYEINNRVG